MALTFVAGTAVTSSTASTTVTMTPAAGSLFCVACLQDNGAIGDSFTVTAPGLVFTQAPGSLATLNGGNLAIFTTANAVAASSTVTVKSNKGAVIKYAQPFTVTDPATGFVPRTGHSISDDLDQEGGSRIASLTVKSTAAGSMAVLLGTHDVVPAAVTGETLMGSMVFGGEWAALYRGNTPASAANVDLTLSFSDVAYGAYLLEFVPGSQPNFGAGFLALI